VETHLKNQAENTRKNWRLTIKLPGEDFRIFQEENEQGMLQVRDEYREIRCKLINMCMGKSGCNCTVYISQAYKKMYHNTIPSSDLDFQARDSTVLWLS